MNVFKGDTVSIVLLTETSLAAASVLWIKFMRPNRTVGHWAASVDGSDDTRMVYQTAIGDLSLAGWWKLQAYVEFVDGTRYHGEFCVLPVANPLT